MGEQTPGKYTNVKVQGCTIGPRFLVNGNESLERGESADDIICPIAAFEHHDGHLDQRRRLPIDNFNPEKNTADCDVYGQCIFHSGAQPAALRPDNDYPRIQEPEPTLKR